MSLSKRSWVWWKDGLLARYGALTVNFYDVKGLRPPSISTLSRWAVCKGIHAGEQ